MITESKLRELLTWSEDRPVDFKAEPHRIDNDHFKALFIKDILAMANTPRDSAAYIIIGVKLHTDGSRELLGVNTHHDDADLQPILNKAKVEPKPSFVYQPVTLDGKSFGVIEIPLEKGGPYFATTDYGGEKIKANRLYFRRGTQNDEATIQEQGQIYKWFFEQGDTNMIEENYTEYPSPAPEWGVFSRACHEFDSERLYMLVLGPNHDEYLKSHGHLIGRLPLSLVLDFDPLTEKSGFYSYAESALKEHRSVHLLSLEDEYSLIPERACYWYAARGLDGRERSLVNGDWRDWNRKYSDALRRLIENLAKASGGKPLTMICLWYAPEYVRELCSAVDRVFGNYASYVFAVPEANGFRDLATQFRGQSISIGLEDILYGIAHYVAATPTVSQYPGIPHFDGSFRLLGLPDLQWLSEDMEVLHSNIELREPDTERLAGREFLRGAAIDWRDLSEHYDADREVAGRLEQLLVRELKTRTTTRLNLYHWPGAGGTTVARRVAWNLHRFYPSVLLRRIVAGETVGRLRKLFQTSAQSILAVIEGADTDSSRLENLYTEVKSQQIPVVFLSVLRRYEKPSSGDRVVFLDANLSVPESFSFAKAYERVVPQKSGDLQRILAENTLRDRTPFHFALTAFGKDYMGLSRYVEARLSQATPAQKQIITFLAMAYFYGHKPLLPQVFAAHLGLPENRTVQMERILDDLQLELLLKESGSKWRPAHQLIAEEILHTVLAGTAEDKRIWKQNLSTWSLEFIRACCKSTLATNDDLLDVLRRIFILRDEHDLLGTETSASSRFSLLVEDVQTPEGRLSIFKELVDTFPYEAHFWGHLGRFYSIVMDEPIQAMNALDRAIHLDPDDPVLYHMKGMCLRKLAYEQMKVFDASQSDVEIRDTVEKAKVAFEQARMLDPDSEHAHISPIQLLLRVIDFGFRISAKESRTEFLVSKNAGWYREQLDEIESLLERVRDLREGDRPGRFISSCEADLAQVYDNYSRALEGWNDLIGRKDVFAPPIRRQIVRAYLARQRRNWSTLQPKEIEKIVMLMEDNMREEPASERNIRIWFRAIRYSPHQDIDVAIDRVSMWRAQGDSIESYFYLYILHTLKALDGSMIERVRSDDLIQASRVKARNLRNRTKSFEWLGKGSGLGRLKHSSELGEWNEDTDFYSNVEILERVEGRVSQISGPESGLIEITSCGLSAFFVPAKAGLFKGRDENLRVSFFLGFSYDGLRAWSIQPA